MSARRAASYRLDPFDLRLFAAVAETGTITAGAREVHLSLAAASERLQGLEHTLGVALMRRAKAGVTLTDAGRALLGHAVRLQRDVEALHDEMAAHARGLRATVRLFANTAAVTEHLPPLLGPFLADFPAVDLDLRELTSPDVLHGLRQGRADLGIVADHVDTAGLETRPFRDDLLVVVAPPGGERRVQGRGAVAFERLLDMPFVGLPADSGLARFLADRAMLLGRVMHHRVRAPDLDAVMRLVADGAGQAIVPERAVRRAAAHALVVRPLADAWALRRLSVCWSVAEPLGAAAAALRDALAPPEGLSDPAPRAGRPARSRSSTHPGPG